MSLFNLDAFIKWHDKDYVNGIEKAEKKADSFASKLGKGLKTASGIAVGAMGAATVAVGALTKEAVESYSDFEQLNGGIDTLFNKAGMSWYDYAQKMKATGKMTRDNAEEVYAEYEKLAEGADLVRENAGKAFKTAGLSMNEYMETATGAAAALINSLEGDTVAAAKYADMSIRDMSDNANKMGTSMESLQFAYSGFAKGNFTMLDNLKLGYSGSKEGMQQLLEKANEINAQNGKHTQYQIDNYADIVEAIHTVQEEMGIAGATEAEAMGTIEGSIKMVKASWKDLVMNMAADDEIDFTNTLDNFAESLSAAIDNVLPRIGTALTGIGRFAEELVPVFVDTIPGVMDEILPYLLDSAFNLIESLLDGLWEAAPSMIETAKNLLFMIIDWFSENGPYILAMGVSLLLTFTQGIVDSIPELVAKLPEVLLSFINYFTDELPLILDQGSKILESLMFGILEAIPILVDALPDVIDALIQFFISNFHEIIYLGGEILGKLIIGLIGAIPDLVSKLPKVVKAIVSGIGAARSELRQSGKYLLEGLWNGINDKVAWLKGKVHGVVDKIKGWFTSKDGFDEHSPSKWSEKVAAFLMEGQGIGLEKNLPNLLKKARNVTDEVKDAMSGDSFEMSADISSNMAANSPATASGYRGINLYLTIESFINNTDKNLRELAATLSEYIAEEIDRREKSYA